MRGHKSRTDYLLTEFANLSTSVAVAATDDYSVTPLEILTGVDGQAFYVIRITFEFSTAGKTKEWYVGGDLATSGLPFALLDSFATIDPTAGASVPGAIVADYGPDGVQLPTGDGIMLQNNGTGAAGRIFIEGYRRIPPNA
jgi:hypothetical protein